MEGLSRESGVFEKARGRDSTTAPDAVRVDEFICKFSRARGPSNRESEGLRRVSRSQPLSKYKFAFGVSISAARQQARHWQ